MNPDRDPNLILRVIRNRKALGLKALVVVLALAGITAFLLRQYTASAVLAPNPAVIAENQPSRGVEIAWAAITDRKISALIRQYQLDSGLVQLRASDRRFLYLRSKISLRQIAPSGSPPEILVSFSGQSRSTTIQVANALAGILAQAKVAQPKANQANAGQANAAGLPPAPDSAAPPDSSTLNVPAETETPLFMMVEPATSAQATGIAVARRYWQFSCLAALLIATITVFLAEWSRPSIDEIAPRAR